MILVLSLIAWITGAQASLAPQDIVQATLQAASYEEFARSGQTPEDYMREVFEEAGKKTGEKSIALLQACDALANLSDRDLSRFEETLGSSPLPCTPALLSRVSSYWEYWEGVYRDRRLIPSKALKTLEWPVDAQAGPVYQSGDLPPGHFALTLDDGPHPTRTDVILNVLAAAEVRADFFVLGENARRMPDIVRRTVHENHVVGSHSMTHPLLTNLSGEEARREISEGHTEVWNASGRQTAPFFRFPYGAKNTALLNFVKGKGMATFGWNVDSRDWATPDPDELYSFFVSELRKVPSGILLFHDIQNQTKIVLPRVLDHLAARGLQTVVFTPR